MSHVKHTKHNFWEALGKDRGKIPPFRLINSRVLCDPWWKGEHIAQEERGGPSGGVKCSPRIAKNLKSKEEL
jgi:hypothetical protein